MIVHPNAQVKGYFVHRDAQRGNRLKEQRELLGWSQQQAADTAGVRREMWARYEAGAEPGAAALARLAAAGLDVIYILTGWNAQARLRLAAIREATEIATAMNLPKLETRAMQEALYARMVAAQSAVAPQSDPNGATSHDLPTPLTPRERALLDNYRHSDEEAQRALDKTSAALAQPSVAAPATTQKRPRKAG